MKELILQYVGRSNFDDKLYKDTEETYFIKDDYNDIVYIGKDPDNDPYGSIKNIAKYKDCKVITVGDENLPTESERFNYMMLDRLRCDCETHLNIWNKYSRKLSKEQRKSTIEEMKNIYNSFSDDKKPEWLTWNQILEYEKQM